MFSGNRSKLNSITRVKRNGKWITEILLRNSFQQRQCRKYPSQYSIRWKCCLSVSLSTWSLNAHSQRLTCQRHTYYCQAALKHCTRRCSPTTTLGWLTAGDMFDIQIVLEMYWKTNQSNSFYQTAGHHHPIHLDPPPSWTSELHSGPQTRAFHVGWPCLSECVYLRNVYCARWWCAGAERVGKIVWKLARQRQSTTAGSHYRSSENDDDDDDE